MARRARDLARASARSTTVDRGGRHVGPLFRPAGRRGSREAIIRQARDIGRWRRCVTPRQTCPRPKGFGRNLRSKTRWFTGFCNSHQVSHFATFFIDARAEISVAESRFGCKWHNACPASLLFLGACGAGVWLSGGPRARPGPPPTEVLSKRFAGRSFGTESTMILPQVHLRKPCYDFSFL